MAEPSPIALFVYNRPLHAKRTVEALARNALASESDLYVFADGAKDAAAVDAVDEVRRYIRTIQGFRTVQVHERDQNFGLARSIVDGVTRTCEEHGRVIVLEDDLVTSPWFLQFMNEALMLYEKSDRVASIHGYCYPTEEPLPETFFLRGADCWGWATWRRAWDLFEPDGAKLLGRLVDAKLEHAFDPDGAFGFSRMLRDQIAGLNDSWAIRWHAACFLENALTLYPGRSLVRNIGNDASGTHSAMTTAFDSPVAEEPIALTPIPCEPNERAHRAFAAFLRSTRPGFLRRGINAVKRRIGVRA